MDTLEYTKRKRGKPIKYDFSALQPGEVIPLKGRKVRKNPNAYVAYWNKKHQLKQVEIVIDSGGNPYVRLRLDNNGA